MINTIALEDAAFEKNPIESAEAAIRESLAYHRQSLEREVGDFTKALETKYANPVSEEARGIKLMMEKLVRDTTHALEWADGETHDPKKTIGAAATAERIADHYLWFARDNMGSDRFVEARVDQVTPQEQEALTHAGRLMYNANILRNSVEV